MENQAKDNVSTTEAYIHSLVTTNVVREPALRSAIQALRLPQGSRGLDLGCGVGLQTGMLADAVGVAGHVTGLDISPEFLIYAEKLVQQAGLATRISFKEGSATELPFDDNTFDWAWSADCVGYVPLEPLPLIKELVRVVKPGGHIAILAWSSEKLLPGYPILEARLNSTAAGIAPFARGQRPGLHFMRALGWLREAGLENIVANTFVGDAYAPLPDDSRRALIALLQMRWLGVDAELTNDERSEYKRLCQVASPDFIVDQPDYYAFFTYSMFHGKVAK